MPESVIEALLALQIRALKLPVPERNYRWMTGRRYEWDFAYPDRKIAIEVQGMVHRIKSKWERDIFKRAYGLLDGWRVLEVSGETIRSGVAIQWIEKLLNETPNAQSEIHCR